MVIFHKASELQKNLNSSATSIGLVPTMGGLHIGHISLIQKAIKDNMKILNDYNFAKKVWETNYNALRKNKDLLKSLLHNFANGKNIPMLNDINGFYLAKNTQI